MIQIKYFMQFVVALMNERCFKRNINDDRMPTKIKIMVYISNTLFKR